MSATISLALSQPRVRALQARTAA
uniref:Uncharacterized protein n=1 Tax=Arundo donax TaxID=35708 RepID=A0A0A8YRG7_ARUDO